MIQTSELEPITPKPDTRKDDTARLRAFITSNFYIPRDQPLDDTTSFLQHGILDSTGVLELVTFVEQEFGIAVADQELLPANFDSLAALAAYVRRKQGCP
jgi:acyl carrier protein